MSSYLRIKDVGVAFGGIKALTSVSCEVSEGEVFGVIGPNGAGKTSLFNCIAGVYRPNVGEITFKGERISRRPIDFIARRGIGRTFQAATVFKDGSVLENMLRAGDFAAHPFPSWKRWFGLDDASEDMAMLDRANRNLEFVRMRELSDSPAVSLSYGYQKILGLGMALMGSPHLLLMDEPAAGLNSSEKIGMKHLISRIRSELGITVVVVEHDMSLIMDTCDRIMVLNRGEVIATGTPSEIQANQGVIDAYLGVDHAAA